MTSWITVCDTCKLDDWEEAGRPQRDGEVLAEQVEAAAKDIAGVKVRRVSCLMGCDHGCNVAIQGPDKLNYTLGRFTPDQDAAEAIVGYAELHAASETGQVPYRQWPQGVKGHFVTRHPPLPSEDQA